MSEQNNPGFSHEKIETNNFLMIVLIVLVIAVGGLVEIVPLFFQTSTTQPIDGVKPYTALQLAGRDIYVREGCYNCHSQMIRPFRAETLRYGPYSVAGESVYDHPFQWGSKRTGPDLARVGGKYSDEWHRQHLANPRNVVPESIMPGYAFLASKPLDPKGFGDNLKAMNLTVNNGKGGMYTEDDIANAEADLVAQATGENTDGLLQRYPKAVARNFDGDGQITERIDTVTWTAKPGSAIAPGEFVALVRKNGRAFLFGDYLETLAVAPEAQRKGVGQALLAHAETRAFGRSKNFFLCVSDFNTAGRAF